MLEQAEQEMRWMHILLVLRCVVESLIVFVGYIYSGDVESS
jgi:hypothetical protein